MRTLFGMTMALLLAWGTLAPSASAQAPGTLDFGSWLEPVKLEDGREVIRRYELSYDAREHEAVLSIYDEDGNLLSSELADPPNVPHPAEVEAGIEMIMADPELASVIDAIPDPAIEGGFVFFEEPCDQVRCLQFTIGPSDGSRLERHVVIDLTNQTIIERDRYPHLRD